MEYALLARIPGDATNPTFMRFERSLGEHTLYLLGKGTLRNPNNPEFPTHETRNPIGREMLIYACPAGFPHSSADLTYNSVFTPIVIIPSLDVTLRLTHSSSRTVEYNQERPYDVSRVLEMMNIPIVELLRPSIVYDGELEKKFTRERNKHDPTRVFRNYKGIMSISAQDRRFLLGTREEDLDGKLL